MPDDLESLLRDTLRARAADAPSPTRVTERTLATVPAIRPVRSRPTWLLPVVAACAVLLVVGAALGGTALLRHLSNGEQPAAPTIHSPAPTASLPSPPPAPRTTHSAPHPSSTPPPSASAPVSPVRGPVPAGFKVADLTFVSPDAGWALGTAPCAHAPCTSLVRTSDGGRSWVGVRPPVVALTGADDCASGCVSHVRFATPLVGYVFGPQVLYLTTDGGLSWQRQSGGADALEISDGTALRVTSSIPGCQPGCSPYFVLRAAVGTSGWQRVFTLPGLGFTTGVDLARTGPHVFVQVYGHPAGGAGQAHSTLFASPDDGATWTDRGEPCPQATAGEIDASALTTASDGSVTVLCTVRVSTTSFAAVSSDGGATFTAGKVLTNIEARVGSASAAVAFLVGDVGGRESLVRSADRGRSWQVVAQAGAYPVSEQSAGRFLGFETSTTGRWAPISDPATVWTTTDGGARWMPYTFR
jgi:photosystem II stability/assembly factor-like uncharacterized protein